MNAVCTVVSAPLLLTTMSTPQAAALLAHVVSQMQSNVEFLVSQNYISQVDASAIMARLPSDTSAPVASITAATQRMGVPAIPLAPVAPARMAPPAPVQAQQQARALWAYNEDGRVS